MERPSSPVTRRRKTIPETGEGGGAAVEGVGAAPRRGGAIGEDPVADPSYGGGDEQALALRRARVNVDATMIDKVRCRVRNNTLCEGEDEH